MTAHLAAAARAPGRRRASGGFSRDCHEPDLPLRLPESIKRPAERLAREDGVSLNKFIVTAVAEKVSALNAATYLAPALTGRTAPDSIGPRPPPPARRRRDGREVSIRHLATVMLGPRARNGP
jgi:hypothetical protein